LSELSQPDHVAFGIRIDPSSDGSFRGHETTNRIDYQPIVHFPQLFVANKQSIQHIHRFLEGELPFEILQRGSIMLKNYHLISLVVRHLSEFFFEFINLNVLFRTILL
jgi:hypothetical protein